MPDNQTLGPTSRHHESFWVNNMATSFNLSPSVSAVIPATQGLILRFQLNASCHIRITNTTGNIVSGLTIWCCYDPNVTVPGVKDVLLSNADINPHKSVALDAGPFNFPEAGAIYAVCNTPNALAMHISQASY